MINDEYKKQMLTNVSMQDLKLDDGIKIAMLDTNGEPLKDKDGNLRYKTYYGMPVTKRGSRYALFGASNETNVPVEAVKEATLELVEIHQYAAHQHLSKAKAEELVTLELVLRDDFHELLKAKRMTPELQNIQRTKDFIFSNVKQKPNMPAAELQAFIHELKEIKAILDDKKATFAAKPTAIAVDGELLGRLGKLKKLIQVGFHVLLNSSKSSDEEKARFDELSSQINDILNMPKEVTSGELQSKIKTLAAAKVFLDKWLPEIAKRQAMAVQMRNSSFLNSSKHVVSESDVVTSFRSMKNGS